MDIPLYIFTSLFKYIYSAVIFIMICMTTRFNLSECLEYFRILLLFTSFLFLNNIVDELKSSVPLYLNKASPVKLSTNQRGCFFSSVSHTHQVVDLHGLLSELTASIGAGCKKLLFFENSGYYICLFLLFHAELRFI